MIWAESECSKISSHSSVEYSSFLENIAKVDVSIEKCWVKLNSLRKKNNIKMKSKQAG